MSGRAGKVAALGSAILMLFGCGKGGNYFEQAQGPGAGAQSLDIAGDYEVLPSTYFEYLSIYQNGNVLTAEDSRGGSWSGQLSNIAEEETTGPGGVSQHRWVGDVMLGGTVQGDVLSLVGVVDYQTFMALDTVIITATYTNESIGQMGDLVLTRISAVPGTVTGSGGDGGNGGDENR